MILKKSKSDEMMLVLMLTNRRAITLSCELELECIRWCFYLKVLLVWFKRTGYTLIASMRSTLDVDDQRQFSRVTSLAELSRCSSLIQTIASMTRRSFIAFLNEFTETQPLLPFHIDLHCLF